MMEASWKLVVDILARKTMNIFANIGVVDKESSSASKKWA